jgi:phytoene synthase
MRDSVKRWLKEARRRARAAPRAALPAILPLALVEPYLAALERLGPNLVRQTADISPLTRVWQLWRASVLGRI